MRDLRMMDEGSDRTHPTEQTDRTIATTDGLQPVGALLPGWLARFETKVAAVRARDAARRAAFFAAGGACWDCRDTGYLQGWQEGMTTDDSDEAVPCGTCGSGSAVARRLRAALVEATLARSGWPEPLPTRLVGGTFDTFPPHARRRVQRVRAFAEERNWTEPLSRGRGLFLLGRSSVGKTGLLIAALRRTLERWTDETPLADLATSASRCAAPSMRRQVWFTTDVALLDALRAGYADDATVSTRELVSRAKTCALLILDDFGKADYKDGAGWGVERLYDILNARYAALLPTWFSTNLGLAQLTARLGEMGEPLMDRILDSCEAITITGAKLRMGTTGGTEVSA